MLDRMKRKIGSSFKLRRKGLVKKASPVYAILGGEEYVKIKSHG